MSGNLRKSLEDLLEKFLGPFLEKNGAAISPDTIKDAVKDFVEKNASRLWPNWGNDSDNTSPSKDTTANNPNNGMTEKNPISKPQPPLQPGQTPSQPASPKPILEPEPVFRLPNGTVGKSYQAEIESPPKIRVSDIRGLEQFGLSFDETKQILSGTPIKDGEHILSLQWQRDDEEGRKTGKCPLLINPDPNSLWKDIPQDQSQPYGDKKPEDTKFLIGAAHKIVAASRRGRSHAHVGSYRDDDFFVEDLDNCWSILAVADGAGSARYSRQGSRIAVTTAGDILRDLLSKKEDRPQKIDVFLEDFSETAQKDFFDDFYRVFQDIAKRAVQAIEKEAEEQKAQARDYATTLLLAVVKQSAEMVTLATFWMGDGAIAVYGPAGTVKLMGTPDSGEFAGQTRFLDRGALNDPDFYKRINIGRFSGVSHILLMTDGISDPKFETDSGLADPTKWDALMREISPFLASSNPDEQLLDWMKFPSPGHHDDRTIAILWFEPGQTPQAAAPDAVSPVPDTLSPTGDTVPPTSDTVENPE